MLNITILVRENTTNYLNIRNNYIINITHVTISTYSSSANVEPSRAVIKGLDHESIQSHPGTQFSILTDFELHTDQKIFDAGTFTTYEKALINETKALFTVVRSSLTLDKIDFSSAYITKKDKNLLLLPVYLQEKQIKLMNSYIDIEGTVLK